MEDLISFLKIVIPTKITFKIIATKKPKTTIVPSMTGRGEIALLFFIPSCSTVNIAAIIKQTLQINTILEKMRMVGVEGLKFKIFLIKTFIIKSYCFVFIKYLNANISILYFPFPYPNQSFPFA